MIFSPLINGVGIFTFHLTSNLQKPVLCVGTFKSNLLLAIVRYFFSTPREIEIEPFLNLNHYHFCMWMTPPRVDFFSFQSLKAINLGPILDFALQFFVIPMSAFKKLAITRSKVFDLFCV